MHVARFFGAGLTRQNSGQRRFALGEAIESGDNVVESFEVVHAVGAAAEFAGGLWTAEKKHTDDCDLAAVEVEDLLQAVLELSDAAVGAAGRPCHALLLQCSEGLAHGFFV